MANEQLKRYRVAVDLDENEREALDLLCKRDLRAPGEVLRWLLRGEAHRHLTPVVTPSPLERMATALEALTTPPNA